MRSSRFSNLAGRTFSRLTVLSYSGHAFNGDALWLCRCECGNKLLVRADSLLRGNTKSCGCYRAEKARERMRKYSEQRRQPIEATDREGIRHIFNTTNEAAAWAGCSGHTVTKYARTGEPRRGVTFKALAL